LAAGATQQPAAASSHWRSWQHGKPSRGSSSWVQVPLILWYVLGIISTPYFGIACLGLAVYRHALLLCQHKKLECVGYVVHQVCTSCQVGVGVFVSQPSACYVVKRSHVDISTSKCCRVMYICIHGPHGNSDELQVIAMLLAGSGSLSWACACACTSSSRP
jgi:hypothetical protein